MPPPPWSQLETLSDDDLARCAGRGEPGWAAALALLERYRGPALRFLAWRARPRRLRADEREEGWQEAALALLRAVAAFEPTRAGGASFRTFLYRVLRSHLLNWLRRLRRAEGRLDRGADGPGGLDRQAQGSTRQAGAFRAPDSRSGDPVRAASWREFRGRLAAALQPLEPTGRWLWDQLASGRPLRDAARELGISYDRAKRLRSLVFARVRRALGEGAEQREPPRLSLK
jgi:RNA polymerase sigma factor (sigma-70 family)